MAEGAALRLNRQTKRVRIRFRHLSCQGGFKGAVTQKPGQTRQIGRRWYRPAAFPVLDGFDPHTEFLGQVRLCEAGFLAFLPDLDAYGL